MKQVVCAVFDSAVQAYARPIFAPSIGVVVRSFSDEVNRQATDNQMHVHPEDFELWLLAEFDESNGMFSAQSGDGFRCLARGKDVLKGE